MTTPRSRKNDSNANPSQAGEPANGASTLGQPSSQPNVAGIPAASQPPKPLPNLSAGSGSAEPLSSHDNETYGDSICHWQMPAWLRPPSPVAAPKRIAILGSTGSIGQSTLNVLRHAKSAKSSCRYHLSGLSGHSQIQQLAADAVEFQSPRVVCTATDQNAQWTDLAIDYGGQFASGPDALCDLAAADDVDVVVAAIVGSAGLPSTLAALEKGKTVALANKETLVVAGQLATSLAEHRDARLLPVDSEHSAIFQALVTAPRVPIRRIILTASGGPFRNLAASELEKVSPAEALEHPTWNMGAKITIDSATMMNKALEIIEARWLFDVPADRIEVVVHPQSIVHSLVEFADGSVLAQLSPPDMQLPIQFALDYPERFAGPAPRMDFSQAFQLDFHPPDMDRFPALLLGLEVARRGGTTGAVLNAANEVAVEAFLAGKIRFTQIVQVCREMLDQHQFDAKPSLEQLMQLDLWARQETATWISN